MTQIELVQYINEKYGVEAEFPWANYPDYRVFRHSRNHKWFALMMTVPNEKINLSGFGKVEILNVKCDPLMIVSLLGEPGFYPAYHMNKANWISIALDGSVSDEIIKVQIEISFDLTAANQGKASSHFPHSMRSS